MFKVHAAPVLPGMHARHQRQAGLDLYGAHRCSRQHHKDGLGCAPLSHVDGRRRNTHTSLQSVGQASGSEKGAGGWQARAVVRAFRDAWRASSCRFRMAAANRLAYAVRTRMHIRPGSGGTIQSLPPTTSLSTTLTAMGVPVRLPKLASLVTAVVVTRTNRVPSANTLLTAATVIVCGEFHRLVAKLSTAGVTVAANESLLTTLMLTVAACRVVCTAGIWGRGGWPGPPWFLAGPAASTSLLQSPAGRTHRTHVGTGGGTHRLGCQDDSGGHRGAPLCDRHVGDGHIHPCLRVRGRDERVSSGQQVHVCRAVTAHVRPLLAELGVDPGSPISAPTTSLSTTVTLTVAFSKLNAASVDAVLSVTRAERLPSMSALFTAVTLMSWVVFQVADVNFSDVGDTPSIVVLEDVTVMVTFWAGWEPRETASVSGGLLPSVDVMLGLGATTMNACVGGECAEGEW